METSTIEGRKPISVVREQVREEFDRVYQDLFHKTFKISSEVFNRLHSDQLTIEVVRNMLQDGVDYYKHEYETKKYDYDFQKDRDRKVWEKFQKALSGTTGEGPVSDVIDYLKQEADYFAKESKEIPDKYKPTMFFGALAPAMGFEGRKQYLSHLAENYETAAKLFENNQKVNFVVGEEN